MKRKNSFIESDILRDIHSTMGDKTFIAFMRWTITKECIGKRSVLKFVIIVRSNVKETLIIKHLELKVVGFNFKKDFQWTFVGKNGSEKAYILMM